MNKTALMLVIAITAVSLGGCFVGKGKAPVPVSPPISTKG